MSNISQLYYNSLNMFDNAYVSKIKSMSFNFNFSNLLLID